METPWKVQRPAGGPPDGGEVPVAILLVLVPDEASGAGESAPPLPAEPQA